MSNDQRKDDKTRAKPEERPTEIADQDLDPVAGGLRSVAGGVDGDVCVTG